MFFFPVATSIEKVACWTFLCAIWWFYNSKDIAISTTLFSDTCQVAYISCGTMYAHKFDMDMVRAKAFIHSNHIRKPRTLATMRDQREAKKIKLLETRYNKLPPVDEIVCCTKNCIDKAIPVSSVRQELRDQFFLFETDCQRKQWMKETFLFGFIDEDDSDLKQFNYQTKP